MLGSCASEGGGGGTNGRQLNEMVTCSLFRWFSVRQNIHISRKVEDWYRKRELAVSAITVAARTVHGPALMANVRSGGVSTAPTSAARLTRPRSWPGFDSLRHTLFP